MPIFGEIFKETGVFAERFPNMTVGVNAVNFFTLQDGKGWTLDTPPQKLGVQLVTSRDMHRILHLLDQQDATWNLSDQPPTKDYLAALTAAVSGSTPVYMVTGKAGGLATIVFRRGKATSELHVTVMPNLKIKVAFRFLQSLDGSNRATAKLQNMSPWQPSDAQNLLAKLNWIYGPQANITFSLADAAFVTVNEYLGDPLSLATFRAKVVQAKNKAADLTVFFVGRWKGEEGEIGLFLHDEVCAVVPIDAKAALVTDGCDPYTVVFAHEVAHYLQFRHTKMGGHGEKQDGVLLSAGTEGTRMNKWLLYLVNAW